MNAIATGEIERFSRPNWVEVDAGAIRANIESLRRRIGPGVALFAALKGNACGFDVSKAGALVQRCGVDCIAVVDMGDALRLRRAGVRCPVLLFSGMWLTPDVIATAVQHEFMVTAHDFSSLELIKAAGLGMISAFLEFNVGGERLGFDPELVDRVIEAIKGISGLRVAGVSAHMYVPDGASAQSTIDWQFARFQTVLARFAAANLTLRYSIIASSKTLVLTNAMNLSAVDPGHLLFGLMPRSEGTFGAELRMALLAVKSRLIHVATLKRSERLTDAPFPMTAGMRLGVIPFGAADGLGRIHCGHVLVNGARAPLVGSPTAEHARIDLTRIPTAKPGDEVVIYGKQQGLEISLEEVQSSQKGIRGSDLTRSIAARVPRIYLNNG